MIDSPTSCAGARGKTGRGAGDGPAVEEVAGVWIIRSHQVARQILQEHGGSCKQDGFSSRLVSEGTTGIRLPVLYLEGEEHRAARRRIARYFTPHRVGSQYRELMATKADELIAWARKRRSFQLDQLSLRLAVHVTAGIIGLSESAPGPMARRLGRFFDLPAPDPNAPVDSVGNRLRRRARSLGALGPLLAFYLRDVRPAVRARAASRADDVISQLIAQGYGRADLIAECLTYAGAGMVTTREFIVVAAWHLLEDAQLRQRYLAADEPERHTILLEILRLEPVVGHVRRRTIAPITLSEGNQKWRIPAGARLDVLVPAVNADPAAVGDHSRQLCPDRRRAPGVRPEVMSFGEGSHRCPGSHVAVQEADILLTRLLRLPVRLIGTPRLGWNESVHGYQVRGLRMSIDR